VFTLRVYKAKSGKPVTEKRVTVSGRYKAAGQTDDFGEVHFDLEPGDYSIRVGDRDIETAYIEGRHFVYL
jgi:hypothetical protein